VKELNDVKINPSKQKVIDAASRLFFQKGFHGTSVRDIAEKADVNVSLISYYFKSKQGLLEYAVTSYYEAYLETMEQSLHESQGLSSLETLKNFIHEIIRYKQTHGQMSSFIQRELSLDSIFVREMAVTYLAKENFYLKNTFFAVLTVARKGALDRDFLFMQLKGMLVTPYVMHNDNEWKDKVVGEQSRQLFIDKYAGTIHAWLDFLADSPLAGPKMAFDFEARA